MSATIKSDDESYAFAKRFITVFMALRSHIATHVTLNYPPGLTPNQMKMLHLIAHRPGVSQTSVAERLGITTASISIAVRELEAQGLIERRPNPDDARVLLLHLAPLGEKIFEQVFDGFVNVCSELLRDVPLEDQAELVERLECVLVANNISFDNQQLNYADKFHIMKDNAIRC